MTTGTDLATTDHPAKGEIVEKGFDSTKTQALAETSATAAAEQARALTQAKFTVAMNRPRDPMLARDRILKDCKRPRFAKQALYQKPVGGSTIEGPSIRFVEAALRHYGNVDVQSQMLFDDADQMIIRVSVIDLETNVAYSDDITVRKTVERRKLKAGQKAISSRLNTHNEVVYLVPATDDDILNKTNALKSKSIRNSGLRILPPDFVEEAVELIRITQHDEAARDPDSEKKALVDAFSGLGVKPNDLAQYLGHDLDKVVPAELVDLRTIFEAMREGEATWADVLETRGKEPANADEDGDDPKAKLRKRKAERDTKAAAEKETAKAEAAEKDAEPTKEEDGDPRTDATKRVEFLDALDDVLACSTTQKQIQDALKEAKAQKFMDDETLGQAKESCAARTLEMKKEKKQAGLPGVGE
jgi:hypothetical protein